jgi:hypothetical protein
MQSCAAKFGPYRRRNEGFPSFQANRVNFLSPTLKESLISAFDCAKMAA